MSDPSHIARAILLQHRELVLKALMAPRPKPRYQTKVGR